MDGVYETEFILDFPEVPKDSEVAPTKSKLIPPVTAAGEAVNRNRRRGQQLAALIKDEDEK